MINSNERRAKKVSEAISIVRSIKDQFDFSELIIALKKANCPYSGDVASILKKRNLIVKRNGFYYFSSPEPVYYKTLVEDLYKVYLRFNPSSKNKVKDVENVIKGQLTVEDAVAYLKAQGFKVMKPVIQYEEM